MKSNLKKLIPDLAFIIAFAIISVIYCSPSLQNKTLRTNDPTQALALAKESNDFHDKTGDWAWWTNSTFGGMPTYFIAGTFDKSILEHTYNYLRPLPGYAADGIFWMLIGGFIFFRSFIPNRFLSSLGAFGFAFCTQTMLFLEAGHASKIHALAFGAIVASGIIYAYKNKPLQAILAFSIGLGLEVRSNHLQITYYLLLGCLIMLTVFLFMAYKEKRLKAFIKTLSIMAVGGILSIASQSSRILTTLEYSKESIRGNSDLTLGIDDPSQNEQKGLDKDYAFEWSYGKKESLTFLIPRFSGGASSGDLPDNSSVASTLSQLGVDQNNINQFLRGVPSYWGDQLFVTGPAYLGSIFCFLFVLGLFLAPKEIKWALSLGAALLLFIAWGDNFKIFNYFLFDHLPFFNKFRAVNMSISLMQLFVVGLGVSGLYSLIKNEKPNPGMMKKLYLAFGLVGGFSLLMYLIPDLFFDFTSSKDSGFVNNLKQSFGNNESAANNVYSALVADRRTLASQDALRSFAFILLSSSLIWLYLKGKIKETLLIFPILALGVIDLWSFDKKYFNSADFESARQTSESALFTPSSADNQILSDPDPNFRVLNTATNFWSSGKESFFHKSIGGYHGAKLKKVQELYEHAMIKDSRLNMPVLNMLNTKYFIVNGENGLMAQLNPQALGNAWFVDSLIFVNTANDEMTTLASQESLSKIAITRETNKNKIPNLSQVSSEGGNIKLISYAPNKLIYQSDSDHDSFAVFSEIYYRGNQDWISSIDGVETEHFRVNYVLRGMNIPSGKHEIVFEFRPKVIAIGGKIDLFSSILYTIFLSGAIFLFTKSKSVSNEKV